MTTVLLVAAGAALGAPLRYLTDRFVQLRHRSVIPWGTWTVNLVASFVLGLVTGAADAGRVDEQAVVFLGSGLCGALSTYSAYSYETLRLLQRRRWLAAAGYVAVSVVGGLAAAAVGYLAGR
jgi:CrcB protein